MKLGKSAAVISSAALDSEADDDDQNYDDGNKMDDDGDDASHDYVNQMDDDLHQLTCNKLLVVDADDDHANVAPNVSDVGVFHKV